jgi:hypothetical protein
MMRLAMTFGLLALLAAPGSSTAAAGDGPALYRTVTIVTGTGEESRHRGFAECLRQVLVKVAGDPRLAEDARVGGLAGEAANFVRDFGYRDRMAGIPVHDEQGTRDRPHFLTVEFEPARIDAALRALGRAPWPEPRPRVAVMLTVRTGDVAYVLASDGASGRDQREALEAAAERLGLPVVLPDTAMAAAGRRPQADVTVVGSLVWSDTALGWAAEWTFQAPDHSANWAEAGVSFDQAFRTMLGRAALILSGNQR